MKMKNAFLMIFVMAGNVACASQNVELCSQMMDLMEQAAQQPMHTITSPVLNETLVGPLQLDRVAAAVSVNMQRRSGNLVHWEFMHKIHTYKPCINESAKKVEMTAYTREAYIMMSLAMALNGENVPHFQL